MYGLSAVRPLAANTMRRVIRGVDKFTIKSGDPFIVPMGYGERKGQAPRVHDISKPLPTVVSTTKHNLCAPTLIQYHTEQSENVRAAGLDKLINTVDASNRYGFVSAHLTEYYGNADAGADAVEPLHTATSHDRQGLVTAHISKFFGGVTGSPASEPLPTITSVDHNALTTAQLTEFRNQSVGSDLRGPAGTITSHDHEGVTTAHVVKFKGTNLGSSAAEPMQTETAGGGQFALCKVYLCKIKTDDNLGHWPEIRDLLNQYCGYHLENDEILLLEIGSALYYIADIGLRMLTPRELYNAMGFPPDYIIDTDYTGKP